MFRIPLAAALLLSTAALAHADSGGIAPLKEKKPATTISQALCEMISIHSIKASPEAASKFPAGMLDERERTMKTLIGAAREMFLTQYSTDDLARLGERFNAMTQELAADVKGGKYTSFLDVHQQCLTRAARVAAPYDGVAVTARAEDGTTFKGVTRRAESSDHAAESPASPAAAPSKTYAVSGFGDDAAPAPAGKPDYQVPPTAQKADSAAAKDSEAYHTAKRAMLKEYNAKLDDHMARLKALDDAIPPEKRTKEDWARMEKESMEALATIDHYSKKMLEWDANYDKSLLQ